MIAANWRTPEHKYSDNEDGMPELEGSDEIIEKNPAEQVAAEPHLTTQEKLTKELFDSLEAVNVIWLAEYIARYNLEAKRTFAIKECMVPKTSKSFPYSLHGNRAKLLSGSETKDSIMGTGWFIKLIMTDECMIEFTLYTPGENFGDSELYKTCFALLAEFEDRFEKALRAEFCDRCTILRTGALAPDGMPTKAGEHVIGAIRVYC